MKKILLEELEIYIISMTQVNEVLQALLIIATIVYTMLKILDLLNKK